MSNYKPYFKYIRDFTMKVAFIIFIVSIVNTVGSIWSGVSIWSDSNKIIYTSQVITMSAIVCCIAGFFYSIKLFSHAMSIRADRLGFLKAALIWGIILSVGSGVFSFILDSGCKLAIELMTGRPVEIYSQLTWVPITTIKPTITLIGNITTNILVFSIGFMIGAIWYRLKIIYSVIIFAIIPAGIIAYVVNYGIRNPKTMNEIGHKILYSIEFAMTNPLISNGIKVVSIITCVLVGCRLLVKAPIKDYANDLI